MKSYEVRKLFDAEIRNLPPILCQNVRHEYFKYLIRNDKQFIQPWVIRQTEVHIYTSLPSADLLSSTWENLTNCFRHRSCLWYHFASRPQSQILVLPPQLQISSSSLGPPCPFLAWDSFTVVQMLHSWLQSDPNLTTSLSLALAYIVWFWSFPQIPGKS